MKIEKQNFGFIVLPRRFDKATLFTDSWSSWGNGRIGSFNDKLRMVISVEKYFTRHLQQMS